MKTLYVCSCLEWVVQQLPEWAHDSEWGDAYDVAEAYELQLHNDLWGEGFETETARDQRSLYHGWNGYQHWKFEASEVCSMSALTDHEQDKVYAAMESALSKIKQRFALM